MTTLSSLVNNYALTQLKTGEAVLQGDIITLGADGKAYWAADPTLGGANSALRPMAQAIAQYLAPVAPASAIDALGAVSGNGLEATVLLNGNFVCAWVEAGASLKFDIYDASKNLLNQVTVDSGVAAGISISIVTLTNGNFALSYAVGNSVKIAVFDPSGNVILAPTVVETLTGVTYVAQSVALSGGGFAVSYSPSALTTVRAAVFSNVGAVVVAPKTIFTTAYGQWVALAALAGGGFVVATISASTVCSFQICSAAGALVGAPVVYQAASGIVPTYLSAEGLAGGGFALTWLGTSGGTASIWSAAGVQLGANISLGALAAVANSLPIAPMPNGNCAISSIASNPSTGSSTSLVIVNGATGAVIATPLNSPAASALAGVGAVQSSNGIAALADNSIIFATNTSTWQISATGVILQGPIPTAGFSGTNVFPMTILPITNPYKAVQQYAILGAASGVPQAAIYATSLQKMALVGVATQSAAQGASVLVQLTGNCATRLTFSQPYFGGTSAGQKMSVVGNLAMMNSSALRSIN